MSQLKVAVVQFTPLFGHKEENFNRIQRILDDAAADIIVLPELCTTGYFFVSRAEVAAVAERRTGKTFEFFYRQARRLDAVVIAGFAEQGQHGLYNSAMIVQPEHTEPYVYRKTHLFYKERDCFDFGDSGFFVVEDKPRSIRIGCMICYDWRFPESARILSLLGADLIVCPANLVTDAWQRVMPARAIENKVYIAVANRAGSERRKAERMNFKGRSAIWDYDGIEMRTAGATGDAVLTVDVFPHRTRDKSFNSVNDVLQDRRPQHYAPLVGRHETHPHR
jgi:predicted amidohydrolase